MSIKIDKRMPFGFKGIWGKCYKLYTSNETNADTITYQRAKYVDIGSDVQFKLLEQGVDKSINNTQPIQNLITKGEYRYVKTTDATFDGYKYESVCQPNDIVYFMNEYWVVDKVDERSVYLPAKQTIYYLGLRKIFDEVIVGEN